MDHSWGYGSEQRLREKNEDCYGVFDFPEYTLAVVCDGMGGHVGGAHASTLAVRTIHDTMRELQGRPPAAALEEAIQRTNLVIYEAARKNHRLTGMGTTVVAAVVMRDSCVLAHVGDSRAYLVRRGAVQLLTRDHTMVNLFVDAELLSPEDAATHPEAHVLSRSLGVERQVEVELSDAIQLEAGDVLFLCSDGVHGVVTDWELGNVDWSQPQEATRDVLKIVGSREGDDNATAVSVMMGSTFEDVPPTAVPEPRRYDEYGGGGGSGMTAVPLDDDNEPPDPALAHTPHGSGHQGGSRSAGSGGYAVYDAPILEPDDEHGPPEPQRSPALPAPISNRENTPQPAAPERKAKPAQPAKPKPAAPKPRSRGMWPAVVVALAMTGVVLVTLMLGVLLWLKVRSGGGGGDPSGVVAAAADPSQPQPGTEVPAPPPPPPATPEEKWALVEDLRKAGDLSAAAEALRDLIATSSNHSYGDRALVTLTEVQRMRMERAGHPSNGKPTDAPVETRLPGSGIEVYGLTDDRREFVEAANAVLSHTFSPPSKPGEPDQAKLAEDQRPALLLELGSMMCQHNRFDEARTRLRELEELHGKTAQAARARELPQTCRQADPTGPEPYPCPAQAGLDARRAIQPVIDGPSHIPKSPLYCSQPPPGGKDQQEAIMRAKAGDCPASLAAVQAGMKVSEDHCRLYTLAWTCFTEKFHRPLVEDNDPLVGWDDLVLVLPNFEGSREKREAQAKDPKWSRLPAWARDAPGGVEYRLEQWSKDPGMQASTKDLLDPGYVADDFAKDLVLEARIAVEFACTPPAERTSKAAMEEAWARRVYVLARALNGPPGVLLKDHREDLQPLLRSMLARSVSEYVDATGRRTPIPQVVRDAYDVGIGNRPAPELVRSVRTTPVDPEIQADEEVGQVQISGRKQ